ncbi:hypothetical protein ACEPAG_9228 [Sanghuangporus baumii]
MTAAENQKGLLDPELQFPYEGQIRRAMHSVPFFPWKSAVHYVSVLPPTRPCHAYITRRWIEGTKHSSLLTLMASHYCLQVIRAEGIRWKSSLRGKEPNLYVEVKLGSSTQRTRTIRKSASPIWNEVLVLALSDESAIFEVQVKNKSTFLSNACVGAVDIKVVDLLAKSTAGEGTVALQLPHYLFLILIGSLAAFVLSSSDHDEAATSSSLIVLHLELNDAMAAAQNSINGTSEDVRRSTIPRLGRISDVTQVVSGQSDLYKAVGDLLSRLSMFKNIVDAVSEVHPFLTIAWKLLSALHGSIEKALQTDQKIISLVQMMVDAFAFVKDMQMLREKATNLHEQINGLLKQTIECCLFVRQYVRRSFLTRVLDSSSGQKVDEFERALESFKQKIDSGLVLHTAIVSMRTSQGMNDISLLQRLNPTSMDGFHRSECLPGTRTEIRAQIIDWIFSDTKQNIFWLYGVAGSGKSTVSTTVASHFRDMSRLGAFLFFERGKSEPSSVIRTIAYKLALFDSSIGTSILSEIENDKDIATASPLHQFRKLLLQPLLGLESLPLEPVMIILDALDECGTTESRRSLMELFRNEFPKLPNVFRFLITSRQEADIDKVFSSRPDTVHGESLDYTSTTSKSDVSLYLRMEMRKAVEEQVEIPEDWHWDENMELLGKAAGGLFIWASTAVRMVKDSDNPFYRLDGLVSDSRSLSWFGLDELYATVLASSGIDWSDARSRDRFGKVFALILLSKVPLPSKTIDGILGFSSLEPSLLILSRLRSLITYSPGGPVSLLHASFSDYLTSCERSSKPWDIDIDEAKRLIIDRCFIVMGGLLRFNICDLESSSVYHDYVPGLEDRVKTRIPSHLIYTCGLWAPHLLDVPFSPELGGKLSDFAHRHLLFWFEVLSLVKVFGHVASCTLSAAASWSKPHDADIASFLQDASKLATIFTLPITQSVPHIYVSAIPLLAGYSQVAAHYLKFMASAILNRRSSGPVNSVAFSRNGRHVASASFDGTVSVWDIESGVKIMTLKSQGIYVLSVSFSPDGNRIVSGSWDRSLRVWNAQDGNLILGPLTEHTDDGTIIRLLTGHSGRVTSVAFSPDSLRLASGSYDHAIRIWNVKGGNLAFGAFSEAHAVAVECVAFSPDGKRVVSCSIDRTIKIREVESGSVISTFELHPDDFVQSVAYSPCGTRIVSGSRNKLVIVWDAESGDIVGSFEGHTNSVDSVTYSPDGKYISSSSSDGTVRIWDATIMTFDSTPSTRHTGSVLSVAFSPGGSHIASASEDSIIVWDAQTGDVKLGPLFEDYHWVAFSQDGSRLLSGSRCRSISIWDVETGEPVFVPLKGCMGTVACVMVSPDCTSVVCGFEDGTVSVWGTADGELVAGPLHGQSGSIGKLAFSPNGKRLASVSVERTIITWNTETWEALHGPFIRNCDHVCSVCFSPDGSQTASGLANGIIMIWDTENGREVAGPLQGRESFVDRILFSRDGAYIISSSLCSAIQVWNVQSGHIVCHFDGHTGVYSLALSPDGQRLVSGSEDNTIRMWDLSDVLPLLKEEARDFVLTSSSSSRSDDLENWVLEYDGWILGGPDKNSLLLWIPPDLRATLWRPRNTSVFSCDFSTRLDFTDAALGERWTECFTHV